MTHAPDRVCVGCFQDESLRELVRKSLAPGAGTCAHCRRSRVRSAPAQCVEESLRSFVWGFYEPVEEHWASASPVSAYLADDEVLSMAVAESGAGGALVEAVLGSERSPDEEPVDLDRWRRRESPMFPGRVRWYLGDLRSAVAEYGHALDHVIETGGANRKGATARNRLVEDLPYLRREVPAGTRFYRARIGSECGRPYFGSDIAAPPPHLARGDRVSVSGQRVLFLADSRETAIAEVRPAIGDLISSAAFVLPEAVRVVDLTPRESPRGTVAARLEQLRRATLAREIGHEFSLPVGSCGTKHYLFTQYVARLIERGGSAGIRYPSAQFAGGFNLVLFDPGRAGDPMEPALTRLQGIRYELGDHEVRSDLTMTNGPGASSRR